MQPDRMAVLDVHGTVDGVEVVGTLSVHLAHGRSSWFVNGEPAFSSVSPRGVARAGHFMDRLLGVPVEAEHPFEYAFEEADALRG